MATETIMTLTSYSNRMAWIIAALAVVLAWVVLAHPRKPGKPRKMHVICKDPSGAILSSEWVTIKRPDHYKSNGLEQVHVYVSRLMASKSEFASVIVSTVDKKRAIVLMKRQREPVQLSMLFDWRKETELERQGRAFFHNLHIEPAADYLAGNGSVPDATRVLAWPLGDKLDQATTICERVLREVVGVSDLDGLDIKYQDIPEEVATSSTVTFPL